MPQISQVLRAAVEVTDTTLPMFFANDSWIDEGTEFLFDFRRASCWPAQTDPAVGSTQLLNMVPNKAHGTITKTATNVTFREGGFAFAGVAGNFIQIGAIADFKLINLGNPDVLYILWLKRETGFITGSQTFLGRGISTAAAFSEFRIGSDANGTSLSSSFSNGTTNAPAFASAAAVDALLNTTMQVGLAFEGGVPKLFVNGNLIQTGPALTKPFGDVNAPIYSMQGNGGVAAKALVKRIAMTRLNQGKTAAERLLQDWNNNHTALV